MDIAIPRSHHFIGILQYTNLSFIYMVSVGPNGSCKYAKYKPFKYAKQCAQNSSQCFKEIVHVALVEYQCRIISC